MLWCNIARRQERKINYAQERVQYMFPYQIEILFITYALQSQKLHNIFYISSINKMRKITS